MNDRTFDERFVRDLTFDGRRFLAAVVDPADRLLQLWASSDATAWTEVAVAPSVGQPLRHVALSAVRPHVAVLGWRQDDPDAGPIELVAWTTSNLEEWSETSLDSLVGDGVVSVLSRVVAHGSGFAALLVVNTGEAGFPSFLHWSDGGSRWRELAIPPDAWAVESIAGTGGGLALFGRDDRVGGRGCLLVTPDGDTWRRPAGINGILADHWGSRVSGFPDALLMHLDTHALAGTDPRIEANWYSRDAFESWAPLPGDGPDVSCEHSWIGPERTVAVLAGTVELGGGFWQAAYRIGWTEGPGSWRAFQLEEYLGIRSVSEIRQVVAGPGHFVTVVETGRHLFPEDEAKAERFLPRQRRLIVRSFGG